MRLLQTTRNSQIMRRSLGIQLGGSKQWRKRMMMRSCCPYHLHILLLILMKMMETMTVMRTPPVNKLGSMRQVTSRLKVRITPIVNFHNFFDFRCQSAKEDHSRFECVWISEYLFCLIKLPYCLSQFFNLQAQLSRKSHTTSRKSHTTYLASQSYSEDSACWENEPKVTHTLSLPCKMSLANPVELNLLVISVLADSAYLDRQWREDLNIFIEHFNS